MKKVFTILAAICAIACSGNTDPKQNEDANAGTTIQNVTSEQLRKKVVKALDQMKAKAVEMGIEGVATASVLDKGQTEDWIAEMRVVGKAMDNNANLVAIAWSKAGEVIATGADSGNPDHQKKIGELGYIGGAYDEFEGYKMAFSFSGATSEDDLLVAKYGIEKMKGYLSENQGKELTELKPLDIPLKKENFIQINIVVDDIYKSAKAWAALLDIPVPEIRTNHLQSNGEYPYTYRGKDVPCDLLVCDINMGSWVMELHQADYSPSSFREFSDKHGFGVHHLGFEVGDKRDEVIRDSRPSALTPTAPSESIPAAAGPSWTRRTSSA